MSSKRKLEMNIRSLIKKSERFSKNDIDITIWNRTALVEVYETSTNMELFLKIPTRPTGKEECERAYRVKRIVGPHEHIIRIFDDEPLRFGKYYGVLMEKADESVDDILDDLITEGKVMDPATAKKIIRHTLRGYVALHKKGLFHRDGKSSNILRVGKIYKVSDFGTATNEEMTYSYQSTEGYRSFELMENSGKQKGKLFTPQTDRFAIGVVYFQLLHPSHQTPHALWDDKYDYFEFAMQEINKLDVDDGTKYILMRAIAKVAPETLPKGKYLEDFAYQSTEDFYRDVSEGPKMTKTLPVDQNEDYQTFLRMKNKLDDILKNTHKYRGDNNYNLISHETIAEIVSTYNAFLKQGRKKNVVSMPKKDLLATDTMNQFEKVTEDEYKLLNSVLTNDFKNTEDMICEKAFLWGPPMTVEQGERAKDSAYAKKSRYTLDEITSGKADFYEKYQVKPWHK
ncbi:MAG: protein kinase [archaeon]